MINVEAYAAAKAWSKRNMGAQAQLVATVTNGSSMPTQRATGAALMAGDFVMPKTSSTFPFTTADSKATFNNKQDVAVWSGIEWLMNAHTFQKSNEVTLANKATESISGTANYQSDVNVETKAKFDTKLDKSTATVSLEHAYIHKADGTDSLMQINTNANAGLAIVRRDLDKQINVPLAPLGDDDATSKKYVDDSLANKVDKSTDVTVLYGTDASGNQIVKPYSVAKSSGSIMQRDNAGRTQVGTPTQPEHAANKQYVDDSKAQVDDVTLGINALQQFEIKDSGVKNAKIEDDAVTIGKIADANISTAIPSAGAVDTKITTEKAVKDALDLKQFNLTAGDNITIGTDNKISSDQVDDSLATSTEKTYSIDKIKEEIRIAGATFRGAFNTKADLDAYAGTKEKNDRAIVTKDETHNDSTTLYSYDGSSWVFEYVVSTKPLVLDEITIDYNASGELEVKDGGISLNKFASHTGDEGKAYTIKSDGTTWLEKVANYKRVSTFAGVSGDTYTAYYLDAPCIVGSVTYEKGVYVWTTASGFELIANTGTGGGTTPILVGVVSPGGVFPATRPDASALIVGDYVKPYSGAAFPFTIGTVTFANARDTAVYMGSSNWLLNASVYQKTNETPVNNKTNESINGASSSAIYQADINAENKGAINSAVNTGLFAKTSDGKINLNLKDRQGNDVVNENIENVVFTDDAQTLTNKTIDADDNTITDLTGSNLKAQTATEKGKTYVVQSDGSWALGNAGSDVDNTTIDLNASDKLEVKDGGLTVQKIKTDALSMVLPNDASSCSHDKLPTEKATREAIDKTVIQTDNMPVATPVIVGRIYQFIGTTTTDYTNGYFYKCVEDTSIPEHPTYQWEQINVQPGSEGDYLPLAGGTMEGTIKLKAGDNSINTTVDNSYVRLAGGTTYEKGASLILKGKNSGMNPGSFVLTANSDGSGKQLIGQSSGALWWCGKELQSAEALLDIFYPIGSYFFGDTPPSLGNWHEVEGDRAVWIKKGTADGTTIDQTLPKPSITCSSTNTGTHIHARGNQNIEGHFNFFWENYSTWGACIGESCTDNNPMFQVANRGNHRMRVNAKSNWTGEMAQAGDHNHAVSADVKTAGAYGTGDKVQPDALVMRVWKRLG